MTPAAREMLWQLLSLLPDFITWLMNMLKSMKPKDVRRFKLQAAKFTKTPTVDGALRLIGTMQGLLSTPA